MTKDISSMRQSSYEHVKKGGNGLYAVVSEHDEDAELTEYLYKEVRYLSSDEISKELLIGMDKNGKWGILSLDRNRDEVDEHTNTSTYDEIEFDADVNQKFCLGKNYSSGKLVECFLIETENGFELGDPYSNKLEIKWLDLEPILATDDIMMLETDFGILALDLGDLEHFTKAKGCRNIMCLFLTEEDKERNLERNSDYDDEFYGAGMMEFAPPPAEILLHGDGALYQFYRDHEYLANRNLVSIDVYDVGNVLFYTQELMSFLSDRKGNLVEFCSLEEIYAECMPKVPVLLAPMIDSIGSVDGEKSITIKISM